MTDLSDIPDDVPAEYLSGAALALRSDEPDAIIDKMEKSEAMQLLRHLYDVPDEYIGKTESNVSTRELRHIAKASLARENDADGNGGD